MIDIPHIKLNPKDILSILEIIKQFENNSVSMKNNIHKYLLKESPTGSITLRNAVFALAFHTLRVLNLITGKGKNLRLDSDALVLLEKYEKEGVESYRKALAKAVLRSDRETGNVVNAARNLNKNIFSVAELEIQLENTGIDSPAKGGKLVKWLRLLSYVRIVEKVNEGYKFNLYQVEAIDKDYEEITQGEFFTVLKNAYDKLTIKRRGNPYIPIPEIEEEVCLELFRKGFSTFDFRRYLEKVKDQKIEGYTVYLSKPGAREANGLRIDGVYYYYVAIFGV